MEASPRNFGNSAHVILPKEFRQKRIKLTIEVLE